MSEARMIGMLWLQYRRPMSEIAELTDQQIAFLLKLAYEQHQRELAELGLGGSRLPPGNEKESVVIGGYETLTKRFFFRGEHGRGRTLPQIQADWDQEYAGLYKGPAYDPAADKAVRYRV